MIRRKWENKVNVTQPLWETVGGNGLRNLENFWGEEE